MRFVSSNKLKFMDGVKRRIVIPEARCSRPKAVANAHIEAGNRTELNSRLRYSCNPGYKRKAGTSSLIQCILWNGSEPRWTDPTLQCIRDPAHSWETPSMESTTQRGRTDASLNPSPNSSPSPASSQSPVLPDGSRPPETIPTPDTSTLGEGRTPLPIPPTDHATVSILSVGSSIGFLVLLATGIAAACCWRRKCTGQGYAVTEMDIPMEAHPAGNEEVEPPVVVPTG
ncbi:interleukin-15 receptor subunit alpha [Cyanistes caeruleus]|uniref:interleukin-15 receptor subunit alpha n=1 Tax=Cyanistes caeruleus TaxID=156563 RepID=UPI000CDA8506|nr:interleukin-15 receptor subunit alpha [Cyanistes caeruleus]